MRRQLAMSISPDEFRPDRRNAVTITHEENSRRAEMHYSSVARIAHLELALKNIVNVLGPTVCSCETPCGLHEEAADALNTAINALGKP